MIRLGDAVIGIGFSALIFLALLYVPPAQFFTQPESARIIVYHVPAAILCVVAFLMGGYFAFRYLTTKEWTHDIRSCAANEVGLLFCILATATGMIFAKQQWGAYWSWDPRQTTILIQMLIYIGYFALRSSIEDDRQRAAYSAGYGLFAAISVPFLIFVLPRIMSDSLHPSNTLMDRSALSIEYKTTLYLAFALYFVTVMILYRRRVDIGILEAKANELASRNDRGSTDNLGWSVGIPADAERQAPSSPEDDRGG